MSCRRQQSAVKSDQSLTEPLSYLVISVGQPDGVSVAQKEEAPETADTIQGEVAPQLNGEKVEKEAPDANDIVAVEEKPVEQKPDEASEVGFKKIFRFVGFKFTLKKDKSEEKDPVKLLTVKDKEGEEVSGIEEAAQKEEEASTAEEKSTPEGKEAEAEGSTAVVEVTEDETTEAPPDAAAADEAVKDEGAEKEEASTPPAQEATVSTFRKLFSGGLFSNLRKKTSVKKTKEEEEKESAVEEEASKTEGTDENVEVEEATKEEAPETPKEDATEETKEEVPVITEGEKSGPTEEAALAAEGEQSEPKEEAKCEATPEPELPAEAPAATGADETKQEGQKTEKEEKGAAEVTPEGELQASQEKTKPQGSPLKKLFTGAGLKKLSTKKQKNKKDTETKLTESGETPAEPLQSSADAAESGPSSPEESGEHAAAVDGAQNESGQEPEGEVASDGEKKKEGIIAWSSFKKLVTPKRRVKRSSESEDEATGEKAAKSATLSSSESAEEETKEEKSTEEEPKTETTEKLVSSTEEPKKKMDTSVSWEALMCMGGPKKRARRTSDSDDDETEKEVPAADGEQEAKPEAAAVSQSAESDGEVAAAAEPSGSPSERESAWDTLKRMVMSKNRGKSEEKPEESAEHVQSDGEAPKDESSFSLRKLFPGRKKKKAEKQSSTDVGSGEEDSDTPAVVPLSEYDEKDDAESEAPAEVAAAQSKAPAEERTPSWIPATVEDPDDKHDQLSDIPEEAENAATPKSVDTDVAEDEAPELREGRQDEDDALAGASADETIPVPQAPESETAQEVVEALGVQISEIPSETSVIAEDIPVEVAADRTEYDPPAENAESTTNSILEPHVSDEAVAICTGLGTKEIAKVDLEKPAMPTIETVTVIRDALSTEVSPEEKPEDAEEARVTEDAVHKAQVSLVEATHLEPAAEISQIKALALEVATRSYEPQMETSGVVTNVVEDSVYIQTPAVNENSPKAVIFDPITPTSEELVCSQSVEVSEATVETKTAGIVVEQQAATEEHTPVKEVVVQAATGEVEVTHETEPAVAVAVAVPAEEALVVTQTVVLAASDEPVKEKASSEETPAQEAEQASEKMEASEEEALEAHSVVIAQTVLQDAVEKVSAAAREDDKPAPAQAVATTEGDVETESPVVVDTPVVGVCQAPAPESIQPLHAAFEVIDTIPIEVAENLREPEEKKLRELKQAAEVKVSEDAVVVVEAVGEENERKPEVEAPDVKETEEVKPQAEEGVEEDAEKELEIHMPVQVVLQSAQVLEAPRVEEEAAVEFDSARPAAAAAEGAAAPCCVTEEAEAAPSGKCAEVMAQVIEVIEEAVKEIEPVSTEITAAS